MTSPDRSKPTRFSGNVSWYTYQSRFRQPIFLHRNVTTVLDANDGHIVQRRKAPIDETIARLRPQVPIGTEAEPILKIEVRSLKRLREASGAGRKKRRMRCSCQVQISQRGDGDKMIPMWQDTEFCDITVDGAGATAKVEMEQPFLIKAGKLMVWSNGNGSQGPVLALAERYTAVIRLKPVDAGTEWPPMINGGKPSLDYLEAEITTLPSAPPSPIFDMSVVGERGGRRRAELSAEIFCKWSNRKAAGGVQLDMTRRAQVARLLTPSPEVEEEQHLGINTLMCYYFLDQAEGRASRADMSGKRVFTTPGFTCPFCNGRRFKNCNHLHFHLLTSHPSFSFKLKPRPATRGIKSGDTNYENCVEVFVDLSKEATINRASDHVPDPRTWVWMKPKKDFEMRRLLKGDWDWLNEKKGIAGPGYRRTTTSEEPTPISQIPPLDIESAHQIPPRGKRKFKVPEPRNGVQGLVFIRSKSKRFIHPNEELSESDDDVDEGWLIQKHQETLDDFEDVAANEQQFMKIWDAHLFAERRASSIANTYMPHTVLRFAKLHAHYLRSTPLLVEFWKHGLNMIQQGTIDTQVLRLCMAHIKGGEWSSAATAKCGIGLQKDPLVLDARVEVEEVETPVRRGRKKVEDVEGDAATELRGLVPNVGFCDCGKAWRRTDMLRCEGEACTVRWFHRSCQGVVERWPKGWVCRSCMKRPEEGQDEESSGVWW